MEPYPFQSTIAKLFGQDEWLAEDWFQKSLNMAHRIGPEANIYEGNYEGVENCNLLNISLQFITYNIRLIFFNKIINSLRDLAY